MKKIAFASGLCLVLGIAFLCTVRASSEAAEKQRQTITLPAVKMDNPTTLMEALKNRKTTRQFSPKALTPQELGDLLWAANGVNRPEEGKRTAPSAMNRQAVNLYAVTTEGAYLYNPKGHTLTLVKKGDFTKDAGGSPLSIVFTADEKVQKRDLASVDAAFIGQNIYLFCAANNLNTVFRGQINRDAMKKHLDLGATENVLFGQTVGHPAE